MKMKKKIKFIIEDQMKKKIYNQIWDKIRELINNVDGVIRFDTDDTLPLW